MVNILDSSFTRYPFKVLVVLLLLFFVGVPSQRASALPPQEQFVRIAETESGEPSALEVAVTDYRSKDGKTVSLVSAVHVADLEYFHTLNDLLATYDVVLYELVAEPGQKPNPNVKRGGILNTLQETFAKLLGASLQLEEVDYTSEKFVHADLSFQDLIDEGARRGETLLSFVVKVISDLLSAQEELEDLPFQPQSGAELVAMYFDKMKLRRFVAQTLALLSTESRMVGLESLEPYVLDIRNAKAIEVLEEQAGRSDLNSIAVFYGAAHMPDLEKRLIEELQAERVKTEWLAAWALSEPHNSQAVALEVREEKGAS